ncbi:SDR family NAD(P)-dependent oxidoreductase [Sorangium cellulosum]|uniref:SDR family NAD(P)-dependent oxidoreductase n=1 Tax=Sorangium TaxID=39643 RepID=UPI001A926538
MSACSASAVCWCSSPGPRWSGRRWGAGARALGRAWRRLVEVNLFGHIAVTQALLPALIRSKGRVVNISSVAVRSLCPPRVLTQARSSRSRRAATPCDAKSPRSGSRWSWSSRAPCARKCPAGRSPPPVSWRRP